MTIELPLVHRDERNNLNSIALQSNAINNAIMYYLACLNTASIERRNDQPIKDLIKEFNSWPVTDASFNVSTWNWTDTFVKAQKFLSISPIFGMYVGTDLRNSSNSIIVVSNFFLPSYFLFFLLIFLLLAYHKKISFLDSEKLCVSSTVSW